MITLITTTFSTRSMDMNFSHQNSVVTTVNGRYSLKHKKLLTKFVHLVTIA